MLGETFYWVFNMSITASVTGILVMLIGLIKKIPKRMGVFLWVIPFLRMTLPFGFNSPYSLMAFLSKFTTKTVPVFQSPSGHIFSTTNFIMAADAYFPIAYKVRSLETVFTVAAFLWLTVFLAIVLTMGMIYFTTLHEIKDAFHLRDNIYLSDKISSPAVFGIRKPRIILPVSYADRDIALVLLHEQTHIHKADNLWRVVGFLAAAAHWFNPLSWLFLSRFLGDLELSCDECVLLRIGSNRIKEYAASLLDAKQGTTIFASSFGGAKIRMRIENILSFKRLTWFSATAFVVLIGVMGYVLLTNAG